MSIAPFQSISLSSKVSPLTPHVSYHPLSQSTGQEEERVVHVQLNLLYKNLNLDGKSRQALLIESLFRSHSGFDL